MKSVLKVAGAVVALWAILLAAGIGNAKAAPQPGLEKVLRPILVHVAKATGGKAAFHSVTCTGPVEKFVYVCRITATTVSGRATCQKYYIAWKGGGDTNIIVWPQSWGCRAKAVKLPPIPYQQQGPGA